MNEQIRKRQTAPQPAAVKKAYRMQKDEFLGEYIEQPSSHNHPIVAGSQVIMTRKYRVPDDIIGRVWKVIKEPRFVRGTRVVYLDGYAGPYPADGLRVVG